MLNTALLKKLSNTLLLKIKTISPLAIFVAVLIATVAVTVVKQQALQLNTKTVKIQVTGKDWTNSFSQYDGFRPPYWLLEKLQVGNKEYGSDGRGIAEILDIEQFERGGGNTETFLVVKLEVTTNKQTKQSFYKGKALETGTEIELHVSDMYLKGQITDANYPQSGYPKKEIVISVLAKDIPSYIADKIEVGSKIHDPYSGLTYSEILDKTISPVTGNYILTSGQPFSLQVDNTRKKAEIKVKVLVEEHQGIYYFSGHQVLRVGKQLWLYFPEVDIGSVIITDIIDATNKTP